MRLSGKRQLTPRLDVGVLSVNDHDAQPLVRALGYDVSEVGPNVMQQFLSPYNTLGVSSASYARTHPRSKPGPPS